VLGAPRSGTTVVGSYLASGASCLDLGEFGGFHAAYNIVPGALGAMPGPFRDAYMADLRRHARGFAEHLATERGNGWFCDATPWNLLAGGSLALDHPEALFLSVRFRLGGSDVGRIRWHLGVSVPPRG